MRCGCSSESNHSRQMREDEVSAWATWRCPDCGHEIELHANTPLEAWCPRCRRSLGAVEDEGDKS
jgi:hypothetical protein